MKTKTSRFGLSTLLAFAAGACLLGAPRNAGAQVVPTNGVVAYYTFDTSTNLGADSSGNTNTLVTGSGSPAFTASGDSGGALYLNGSSTLTNAAGFPTGVPTNSAYTIAVWEKIDTGCANNGGFVGWGNNAGNQCNNFRLNGANSLVAYWYGNDFTLTGLAANPMDGNWHVAVVTWDGTTQKIYLDGVSVGSRAASGLAAWPTGFIVGKTTGDTNFKGWLDNLAIYNRALTASEVTNYSQILLITLPTTASALVGSNALATLSVPAGATATNSVTITLTSGNTAVTASQTVTLPQGVTSTNLSFPILAIGASTVTAAAPGLIGATIVVNGYTTETWGGAVNNVWDINATMNWTNGGVASVYVDPNQVIFNDTGSNPGISISAAVSPSSVIVSNNAVNYSFSGAAIAGFGTLTKNGSGTLTLNNTNTYAGNTVISAGTLTIGGAGALGGGTYLGNITNNGALNYGSSAAQTLAGIISGSGTLTNSGSGTLTLSASNTYSGGTILNSIAANLTVNVGANGALGSGPVTVSNATGSAYLYATTSVTLTNAFFGQTSQKAPEFVGAAAGSTLTLSGSLNLTNTSGAAYSAALMVSGGPGAVTLSGAYNLKGVGNNSGNTAALFDGYTGSTVNLVGGGTVSSIALGWAGTKNTLNFAAAGTITISDTGDNISVGQQGGSGVINQTTGTVNGGGNLMLSRWDVSYGAYNLSGGTLNLADVYNGGYGNGAGNAMFTVAGGSVANISGATVLNYQGGTSQLYVNGGAYNNGGNVTLQQNNTAGTTVASIANGSLYVTNGTFTLNNNSGAGTNILNLNGSGTNTANAVTSTTSGVNLVNFNGGTLAASPNAVASFLTNVTAEIYSGGGTLNNNGKSITIAAALQSAGGLTGVSGFTGLAGGSGYYGAPVIKITGGGGTGASALAQISAAGVVTNIIITSAGTGYASLPTFNFAGGGGLGASATAATAANAADGGVTFTGGGTTTLMGTNTYTGVTLISAGELFGVAGGSISNSAVTVASGATNGVQVTAANGQWVIGGLTYSSGTASADFEFGGVAPSSSVAPVLVNGNLAFNGTLNVIIKGTAFPPSGTFPLIKYTGTLSGTPPTTPVTLPSGVTVGTLVNDVTNKSLDFSTTEYLMTFSPNATGAIVGSNALVTLSVPSAATPVTITLSSGNTGVTASQTVTLGAGVTSTNLSFPIVGGGVSTVTATATGLYQATVQVTGALPTINLPSQTAAGVGANATATLTLTSPYPFSGSYTITLTSGNTGVTASQSVTLGAGVTSTNLTFPILSHGSSLVTATGTGLNSGSITVQETGFVGLYNQWVGDDYSSGNSWTDRVSHVVAPTDGGSTKPVAVPSIFNGHAGVERNPSGGNAGFSIPAVNPPTGYTNYTVAVVLYATVPGPVGGAYFQDWGIIGYDDGGGAQPDWGISWGGNNGLSFVTGIGGVSGDSVMTSAALPTSQVHAVALQTTGTNSFRTYVDGTLVASNGVTLQAATNYNGTHTIPLLSTVNQNFSGVFPGAIAEVRIYTNGTVDAATLTAYLQTNYQSYGITLPASTGAFIGSNAVATLSVPTNATASGSVTVTLTSGNTAVTASQSVTLGVGVTSTNLSFPILAAGASTVTATGTGLVAASIVVNGYGTEIWNGLVNNVWNINTTTNWTENGGPFGYLDGAPVVFNDTGTNSNINISTTVAPGGITVSNNAVNYSFSGAAIAGFGTLTKNGSGTLTLSNANTYAGNTVISNGTLALSGSGLITNTANIVVASNAVFDVSGLSSPFTLAQSLGSQTLSNSAPGAIISGTNNAGSGTVSLMYDGVNPAFTITNGGLTLSSSTTFKVSKTGATLPLGVYKVIAKATAGNVGLVAGVVPAVAVNNGASSATLGIFNGELYLTNGGNSSISYAGSSFTYNGSAQTPTIAFSGSTAAQTTSYVGTGLTTYSSVNAPTNVGTYYVSNTVAADANYFGATNSQSFTIGKATATVVVTPYSVTYDGASHSATVASITGVPGEAGGTVGTVSLSTTHVNAGTYASDSWSFTGAANYNNISATTITDTISKATPVVSWSNPADITYGTALGGTHLNATAGGVAGSYVYTPASGTVLNAGASQTLSVQFTPSDTVNYNTPADATVSINVDAASLTITANAQGKTYGTLLALGTSAFTVSGLTNGDSVSSVTLASSGATNTATVGSYVIVATNAVGSGLTNYTISYGAGTLTVNPLAVALTGMRAYDGTTNAAAANLSVTNTVNSDGVTVTSGTGGLASANVGTNDITSFGNLSLDTGAGTNYTLAGASGALVITNTPLVITANDDSKTYDGNGYSGGNGVSYDGFVAGETNTALTGSLSYGGTSQNATNAGSYNITPGGYTATNYLISYVDGTLTINPLGVTVTADVKTKVYGTTDPSLTYSASPAPISPDTFSGSLSRASGENVGSYAIGQNTLALSANYTLTYNGTNLVITPAALGITANNASKNYGQTVTFAGTEFTAVGLQFSDNVTGATISSAGATNTATVAGSTYPIVISTATGTGLGNYTISYTNGTLTVTPAALGVTADNASRAYGATNPVFTASYSGFVNGETAAVISGSPSLTTVADTNSPVGGYTITAAVGSLTASNYSVVNFTNGTLTVAQAVITVTADNTNRLYGAQNPVFTANYSGFLNGDTSSVISGSPSLTTSADTNSPVGSYAITNAVGSLSATNYAFTLVNGTLTINQTPLTITANPASKTYDGAGYTGGNGVSYVGFVAGETNTALTGSLSYGGTSQNATNAGSFNITPGGYTATNYLISYVDGTLTINPLGVTVTADSGQSKVYGTTDPTLTYTPTPALITPDTFSGSLSRAAGETVAGGPYAISQGTLAASGNYSLTFNGANFAITTRPITITAQPNSKVYDGNTSATNVPTLTTGTLASGDGFSSFTEAYASATVGTGKTVIPSATITNAAGSATANYALTAVNDTASVIISAASTNALLASLSLTPAGTLSPTFAAGMTSYNATNTYLNNPVTVAATSSNANATLQFSFNGGAYGAVVTNNLTSGSTSLLLNPPMNTVVVRVVSQDLSQTNVYTVNVLLQPSQSVPKLTNSVSGNSLVLSWPADHLGYRLLVQTNNLNKGVSGNINDWGTVPNSANITATNIAILKTGVTNQYYKLVYP